MTVPGHVDLVFIHGLFSSGDVWESFEDLLTKDPDVSDGLRIHRFQYSSPRIRLRPDRRIAEMNDIADQLGTYLRHRLKDATAIVLVSHSQGGLVVQRFLSRELHRKHGRELSRIKHFTMLACPNTGSGFFLTVRKALRPVWRNAQERELRPFDRSVTETQQHILADVVHAKSATESQCPIEVVACGVVSDNVVPAYIAKGFFPRTETFDGDHFSVTCPANRSDLVYLHVKKSILAVSVTAEETERAPRRPQAAPRAFQLPEQRHTVSPPFKKRQGALLGEERRRLINETLQGDPACRVRIFTGIGGSGKSRLALEIAYRAKELQHRVWWVPVNELDAVMRVIAIELGIPDAQIEQAWQGKAASATDLLWQHLNRLREPWLLVLDNADDPRHLAPQQGTLADGTGWLRVPESAHGLVVVTTRVISEGIWSALGRIHRVNPLDENDGADLLQEHAGPRAGTREQARELSAELGGLPLALRKVSDYIRAADSEKLSLDDSGIRDFSGMLRAVRRRMAAPPGSHVRELDELLGRDLVEQVYGIGLDLLAAQGLKHAAPLLKLFACMNIARIPYRNILTSGTALYRSPLFTGIDEKSLKATFQGLVDLGLVERDEDVGEAARGRPPVLHLHPVVHVILRDDEDVKHRRQDYCALSVALLLDAVREHAPDHPSTWPLWSTVVPHVREITGICCGSSTWLTDRSVLRDLIELARLTTRYLIATALLGQARQMLLPLIDSCPAFGFERDSREVLGLRHEKGRIALESEEHAEAETEFRQVVQARSELLGEDHLDTLASRHKLARAIFEQGRWEEALPALNAVKEAEYANPQRGPEHFDTLVVRHSLANTLMNLDHAAEAEIELREILAVNQRRGWPPSTPESLKVHNSLARCLAKLDRPDEAEEVIESALRDADQPPEAPMMTSLRYTRCLVLLMRGHDPGSELRQLLDDRMRINPDGALTEEVHQLLRKTTRRLQTRKETDPDTAE